MNPAHIVGVFAASLLTALLLWLLVAYAMRQLRRQGVMFVLIAAGFLYAAATKPSYHAISFPRTDPDQQYLYDSGSYVSNDVVRLSFEPSVVLPQSAMIYLDYIPNSDTNSPAITYTNATLATFPRPLDFTFPNAFSNAWFCYTTWTPGPSVHTNGIAQINWQLPTSGATNICAMLNTAVYTNDTVVVTQEPDL